jgi:hypothetical protein
MMLASLSRRRPDVWAKYMQRDPERFTDLMRAMDRHKPGLRPFPRTNGRPMHAGRIGQFAGPAGYRRDQIDVHAINVETQRWQRQALIAKTRTEEEQWTRS